MSHSPSGQAPAAPAVRQLTAVNGRCLIATMPRRLFLTLIGLSLVLAGCGTPAATRTRVQPATLASNTRDYDRYVEQRTDALVAMGAFKNRGDAELKARTDATNRFGERDAEVSTSWTWSTRRAAEPVNLDPLAKKR